MLRCFVQNRAAAYSLAYETFKLDHRADEKVKITRFASKIALP